MAAFVNTPAVKQALFTPLRELHIKLIVVLLILKYIHKMQIQMQENCCKYLACNGLHYNNILTGLPIWDVYRLKFFQRYLHQYERWKY